MIGESARRTMDRQALPLDWVVLAVDPRQNRITLGQRQLGIRRDFFLPRPIVEYRVRGQAVEVRTNDDFIWTIDIPNGHRSRHRRAVPGGGASGTPH